MYKCEILIIFDTIFDVNRKTIFYQHCNDLFCVIFITPTMKHDQRNVFQNVYTAQFLISCKGEKVICRAYLKDV